MPGGRIAGFSVSWQYKWANVESWSRACSWVEEGLWVRRCLSALRGETGHWEYGKIVKKSLH